MNQTNILENSFNSDNVLNHQIITILEKHLDPVKINTEKYSSHYKRLVSLLINVPMNDEAQKILDEVLLSLLRQVAEFPGQIQLVPQIREDLVSNVCSYITSHEGKLNLPNNYFTILGTFENKINLATDEVNTVLYFGGEDNSPARDIQAKELAGSKLKALVPLFSQINHYTGLLEDSLKDQLNQDEVTNMSLFTQTYSIIDSIVEKLDFLINHSGITLEIEVLLQLKSIKEVLKNLPGKGIDVNKEEVKESKIQESLNRLSLLTRPREYSADLQAELEHDTAEVTSGFNELTVNIINGELIDPKLSILVLELSNFSSTEGLQEKLMELWGSFSYGHKDSGEIAKADLQKEILSEDLPEFTQKLKQISVHINNLLDPEGLKNILNPDPEMFSSKSSASGALAALGYIYLELVKQKLFENGKYENTRRKIAADLMFIELEGKVEQRKSIAYSLTGHIGVGKSVVEGLGIPMHGSGTTAISGAALSQFHKVFQGIMKSWDPMRNRGYPIYPLMEILFEAGSLGFRKYYDERYGKDLGILIDGYPRTITQLEFFIKFALEFGIDNIEDLFKLVFMKFECEDILNPGEEILELIIERVILSRTFDGLGIAGSRNDHFKEIIIEGFEGGVAALETEVVKMVTEAKEQTEGNPEDGWTYKRNVVLKALELFKAKFAISKISLNPIGRLKSYDNGMNSLARELETTNSPVKPINILVDKDTKREDIKTKFVANTFGTEMLERVEFRNKEA